MKIQTSHFPELDGIEKAKANQTIEAFYKKFETILGEQPLLHLHHKEYDKTGTRKKHVINAKLSASKYTFTFEQFEWNFLTALQKTLKGLLTEIKSKK